MDNNKAKFMSEYWVEDRHDFLKTLSMDEQKRVVDSLSPDEVDDNVNYRRFQEQYICDYVDYLWGVSKRSFWRHIATSLKNPEGLIPSESDFTVTILKTERMPKYVFKSLVKALERLVQDNPDPLNEYFCEMHAEIVCSKLLDLSELERIKTIVSDWFDNLATTERKTIHSLFSKYIDGSVLESLGLGL